MRLLRRLSGFARVAVALGLLAALWVVTLAGITRANEEAEDQRIADRLLLAKAAVRPLAAWLEAGRVEALQLGAAIGPGAPRAPIDAYMRAPRAFGRSAFVVNRSRMVVATSTDRLAFDDRPANPCIELLPPIEDGTQSPPPVTDESFNALVSAAAGSVSPVFPVPGRCDPGVAVAVPTAGGDVLVLVAPVDEVVARLADAAAVVPDLTVILVTADGETVLTGQTLPLAPRSGIAGLVGDRDRPHAARHRSGDAEYVGAFQPAGQGWGVVVDQEADAFDVDPSRSPALVGAGVLTAVFAVVFALVAWFDVRGRRAARRADEHRQAFLAIVGHELRTPLTVIKGYTDTLASRWEALDDRSRQMLVESMAPQAQRQARVIEHLLTAASLQAGSYARPIVGPVQVEPVLHDVAAEFRALAPLHTFDVDVEPGAEGVQADGATLSQVVGELVDNAVRYSPSGGWVWIAARRAGRGVEITVDDEGVGLPSDAERLFDPFVQGESVDRRVHDEGGVGVGLYIARALLEAMGGTVRAERRRDGGSRFVVTLHAARVATPAPHGGAR
jgi:signal transduction histidine kinase